MRPLRAILVPVLLAAATAPGLAASRHSPGPSPAPVPTAVPVVIFAAVAPGATTSMTPLLWRRLLTDYVGGRPAVIEDDADSPDEARCRGAHGFTQCARGSTARPDLPGWRAIPRAAMESSGLSCATASPASCSPARVAVESDPLAPAKPGTPKATRSGCGSARARRTRSRTAARPVAGSSRSKAASRWSSAAGRSPTSQVLHAVADAQGLPARRSS